MSDDIKLSRREFFKDAAIAGAAVAATGMLGATPSAAQCIPEKWDYEADVLIVGAGVAGLWAAYATSKAGLKTLLVEKEPTFGGDSILATGVMWASTSKAMVAAGIPGTDPEVAYKAAYDATYSKWRVPELGRIKLVEAVNVMNLWTDLGAKWMPPVKGHIMQSAHIPAPALGNMGNALTPLFDAVSKAGCEVMFQTKATNFVVDANNVAMGMRAQNVEDFKFKHIKAKRILLATGTFVCNQEMVARYMPKYAHVALQTHTGMGQGIEMALPLGASLEKMEEAPGMVSDTSVVVVWAYFDSMLHVTPVGKRFINEMMLHEVGGKIVELGFAHWYAIFDDTLAKGYQAACVNAVMKTGIIQQADTIEDLAKKINVPADNLAATYKRFNEVMASGKDSDFGRRMYLRPLKPPLYAALLHPTRYKTFGGLRVNQDGQLINASGAPIPNVYAAGNAIGSMTPNLTDALSLGYHIDKVFVRDLKKV